MDEIRRARTRPGEYLEGAKVPPDFQAFLNFEWVDLAAPEAPCGRRGKPKPPRPSYPAFRPSHRAGYCDGAASRKRARSGRAPGAASG